MLQSDSPKFFTRNLRGIWFGVFACIVLIMLGMVFVWRANCAGSSKVSGDWLAYSKNNNAILLRFRLFNNGVLEGAYESPHTAGVLPLKFLNENGMVLETFNISLDGKRYLFSVDCSKSNILIVKSLDAGYEAPAVDDTFSFVIEDLRRALQVTTHKPTNVTTHAPTNTGTFDANPKK